MINGPIAAVSRPPLIVMSEATPLTKSGSLNVPVERCKSYGGSLASNSNASLGFSDQLKEQPRLDAAFLMTTCDSLGKSTIIVKKSAY